eukprot:TRINITY_DN54779_c0_g1_i1.p1 TRINITY_DN54779_c0_g1~~TRINITY_DN54779_c0_g1_i1.p1  ORF type:complete len:502 (+),score=122.11 TRINITY_DN54779_c0_g1_i1:54-1508(+)
MRPSSRVLAAVAPRLRRTVHFVPGISDKFLGRCLGLGADSLVLDLEDSVRDKEAGRAKVREWLLQHRTRQGTPEILVRINPLDSGLWKEDLEACVEAGADGFMVPKVNTPEDMGVICAHIAELERACGADVGSKVLLPIASETPEGVLNMPQIAKASKRIIAITWGAEDLSAELGSMGNRHPETNEYLDVYKHTRIQCLLAAKAANVQAIDGVYADVRDKKGLLKETVDAKLMGFDGKLSLHPDQISAICSAFRPSVAELQEAKDIVELFDSSRGDAAKAGAMSYKGRMVDIPHYRRSQKILARAAADSGDSAADAVSGEAKKPEFVRVYHGKYFEDLEPGMTIHHALTRTVTEADNIMFTTMSMNTAPVHLDAELAKQTEFKRPLFNSMFTLAMVVGMSVLETTHGTLVAQLGLTDVKFPKPVFAGDTLRAETKILERRESKSRPTQGIVSMENRMYNQHGDLVCSCVRQALMKRRPAEGSKL